MIVHFRIAYRKKTWGERFLRVKGIPNTQCKSLPYVVACEEEKQVKIRKKTIFFAQPDRSDLTAFPLNNKLTSNS